VVLYWGQSQREGGGVFPLELIYDGNIRKKPIRPLYSFGQACFSFDRTSAKFAQQKKRLRLKPLAGSGLESFIPP